MTATDPRADRALAQIDGLTAALGFFLGFIFLLGAVMAVTGGGSVLGFGDPEVCASARPGEVPWGASERRSAVLGLEAAARWWTESLGVCVSEPGFWLRLGGSLGPLAEVGLFAGALVLLRRVIRRARSAGLFAPGVATRVQTLGRFVIVAAPLAALLAAVGEGIVHDAAVRGVSWHDDLLDWDLNWTALIVGVGLVSMAKVMAYARLLQDDVDGMI
jgi:hypothetical protein